MIFGLQKRAFVIAKRVKTFHQTPHLRVLNQIETLQSEHILDKDVFGEDIDEDDPIEDVIIDATTSHNMEPFNLEVIQHLNNPEIFTIKQEFIDLSFRHLIQRFGRTEEHNSSLK